MPHEPTTDDLQLLVEDAFRLFEDHPSQWPDLVQINRSGLTDANIRGIWSFQDRVEFFHVSFPARNPDLSDENATSPESSGGSE